MDKDLISKILDFKKYARYYMKFKVASNNEWKITWIKNDTEKEKASLEKWLY